MEADSFQTTACWWLSLITLGGIGLNAAFGWWWADPVAALGMTYFLVDEGLEAWRGEDCCSDEEEDERTMTWSRALETAYVLGLFVGYLALWRLKRAGQLRATGQDRRCWAGPPIRYSVTSQR